MRAAEVARRYPRTSAVFARLLESARARVPGLEAVLDVDPAAGEPCCRQFAWCEDTRPIRIVVAPKLEEQGDARIEGVLRHEFGHAVDFAEGLTRELRVDGAERVADTLARWLFGKPIRYDAEDVQTIGAGVAPRPERLGL